MSLRALVDVSYKLMSDNAFKYELMKNPDRALQNYDLTPEEVEALVTRDRWLLESCGLEEWTARWITALS